jgi:L-fuculose-phosphate aldolase
MLNRFADARHDVWLHARKMWESGLVTGSAGNVSCRVDHDRVAITPTSLQYDVMQPEDIVITDMSGSEIASKHRASYELPMHLVMYRERPDIDAIVHTHAPFVTTLSVLRKPLPPLLDEMVVHLGGAIEIADYAFTGTQDVGRNALRALGDRSGVILANHGNVCVGKSLASALHRAVVMESAARLYVQALACGEPKMLSEESVQLARAMYERRRKPPSS